MKDLPDHPPRLRIIVANTGSTVSQDINTIIRDLVTVADVIVMAPENIVEALAQDSLDTATGLAPESESLSSCHPLAEQLTPRQVEVLELIVHGNTNKEIARHLNISPSTVRVHVSALLRVLGVSSRTAAAAMAGGVLPWLQKPPRASYADLAEGSNL
ncbi:MAG: response regulator transcription factor [Alphaproteobacteria bacterium]|nr:response regulator transcription factor [Alphaproteobacteria bacterium]